jgi:hypothetical protein
MATPSELELVLSTASAVTSRSPAGDTSARSAGSMASLVRPDDSPPGSGSDNEAEAGRPAGLTRRRFVSFSEGTAAGSFAESKDPISREPAAEATLAASSRGSVQFPRTASQQTLMTLVPKAFLDAVRDAFDIFADKNSKLTEHAAASLLRYLDKEPPASIVEESQARLSARIGRTSTRGQIEFDDFVTMCESARRICWLQRISLVSATSNF